jgi:hypothetical protein
MRYYIRQLQDHISGPYEVTTIREWIKEGKVRAEMEFSVDRSEWIWGIELVDLFPPRRVPARNRKRRVLRGI